MKNKEVPEGELLKPGGEPRPPKGGGTVKKTVKSGISFGTALAMVLSYTTWKSVGWAIVHGLMSWVYVIYFVLKYC